MKIFLGTPTIAMAESGRASGKGKIVINNFAILQRLVLGKQSEATAIVSQIWYSSVSFPANPAFGKY